MAKIYTSAKPFKITKIVEILKEVVDNPDLASKNQQLFKTKEGSGYVYHAEDRSKLSDWKSDLYRLGEFLIFSFMCIDFSLLFRQLPNWSKQTSCEVYF